MLFKVGVAALLAAGGAWILTRWLETRLAFQPIREWDQYLVWGAGEWEEITITAEDGVSISAAWFPSPDPRGVIVHCHGNAGNLSHRIPQALDWRRLGYSVLLFDYRGYGRSGGRPSEAGLVRDATAACREAARRSGAIPILSGRSLGCYPAAAVACREPLRGLILDSPFPDARAMARLILPLPGLPLLLSLRLDTRAAVSRIACPLLVLHGERDRIVPIALGRAVYEAAPQPKRFFTIPGVGHNDDRSAARSEVAAFLDTLEKG